MLSQVHGVGPTEVSATVDLMVASVQTYFENSKSAHIELNKIQNKTSEHITQIY